MLRKLSCQNWLAALMITSIFAYGMPPVASAGSTTNPGGTVIEIFSNDGRSARLSEAPPMSDVLKSARNGAMMSRGFLLASPEAVASMRGTIARLKAVHLKNKKADFALSLGVLDAVSAASGADAHQRLARLPIRVERTVGTATVTTAVYVRGNVKFRVTSPLPATPRQDEGTVTSAPLGDTDMPSASDDADAYASVASYRFSQSGCQDNPDDPCATQQDIDDALAANAAIQSDLDDMSDDFSADEADCYTDGCCAECMTATPGPNVAMPRCLSAYLNAAGGILCAVGAIVGSIALTVSPDPVSKGVLWGAWLVAAGCVAWAGAGVIDAYRCHYNLAIAAIWTDLPTDRADFRLKAMAALLPA